MKQMGMDRKIEKRKWSQKKDNIYRRLHFIDCVTFFYSESNQQKILQRRRFKNFCKRGD